MAYTDFAAYEDSIERVMRGEDETRHELRQGEPGDAPLPRGWGGARPGSGRPPSPHPLRTLSVRLSAEDIASLRALGGGNASLGVRRALAFYDAQIDRLRHLGSGNASEEVRRVLAFYREHHPDEERDAPRALG